MKYLCWLARHTVGMRLNILTRILLGLGQTLLALLVVWLSKRFIDEVVFTESTREMVLQVAILASAVILGVVIRQFNYYLANKAFIRKVAALRLSLFAQLFRRKLFGESEIHSGDISSRMAKDIDAVSETIAITLPQMVVMMMQLAGAFLLMHWFDPRLAWALVLLTPLAIALGKFISHRLRSLTLSIRQDESHILMKIQESMEHNALLRSLQGEQWIQNHVGQLQQQQNTNYIRRTRFLMASRFALGCTFGLGYMAAFVWGAYGLRSGLITFGVMTSFLQLVGQIQQPILSLLNAFPAVINSTASIDRLQEMADSQTEESDPDSTSKETGNAKRLPLRLGIRMEGVSYRYAQGDREVISALTHTCQPGSKTAILGTTGVGKTTLFRLILGLIQPDSGSITFYGEGFSHPADRSMRRHLVFVPQGNTLMSGSIRDNLLVARPDATDTELLSALHTACADFVNELPQGLDTCLQERGGGLSEGQAQRIAIARGLLRPGSILLLDEVSSALDEPTERELFSRLLAARPHGTILLITHRPSVADICDHQWRL